MKITSFLLFAALLLTVGSLQAQQNAGQRQQNIVEALATPDSATHATVRIYQDKRIEQLVCSNRSSNGARQVITANGFRVQVFSSNVQRTGKNEAFRIERQIREQFPEQAVYVNYVSPFWKVRVGDFKTQAEAQSFRSQLLEVFQNMRNEIYIVREQIIISGSK